MSIVGSVLLVHVCRTTRADVDGPRSRSYASVILSLLERFSDFCIVWKDYDRYRFILCVFEFPPSPPRLRLWTDLQCSGVTENVSIDFSLVSEGLGGCMRSRASNRLDFCFRVSVNPVVFVRFFRNVRNAGWCRLI